MSKSEQAFLSDFPAYSETKIGDSWFHTPSVPHELRSGAAIRWRQRGWKRRIFGK